MKYLEFEKRLSEKLYNQTAELNVDSFIDDLYKLKRRRRIGFLWFFGAALCTVSLAGLFWFNLIHGERLYNIPSVSIDVKHGKVISEQGKEEVSLKTILIDKAFDGLDRNQEIKVLKNKTGGKSSDNIDEGLPRHIKGKEVSIYGHSDFVNENQNFIGENSENQSMMKFDFDKELMPATIELSTIDIKHVTSMADREILELDNGIGCPDFAANDVNSGFELIAELGVFKPLKSLNQLPGESDILTGLRQNGEKSKLGVRAGIFAKYNLTRSPFYFFGGVNYSRFVEGMSLDFEIIETDTVVGIVSITESEAGDTITYIYGDIITETVKQGNKTRHYTVSTIDVPLHVGYELNLNKLSIGTEFGVSLNVTTQTSGNFLSSTSDFGSIEEVGEFKKRIGLRYDGKMFLGYQLSDVHKLYASAAFNYFPNSFSNSQVTEQKYRHIGFNIGYGLRF